MFMIKAINSLSGSIKHRCVALTMLAVAASSAMADAQGLSQRKVVSNVPGTVEGATSQGRVVATQPVKVTLWMNLQNKAAFDQRVAALYTPGSATYHKWLTTSDLLTYAPTRADLQTVKEQLEKDGLTVTVDESNPFAIRAQGTAAQMEAAFGTELNNFKTNGTTFRANVTEATVKGAAASLVLSVSGLDNVPMKPQLAQAVNPKTKKPAVPIPLAAVKAASNGLGGYFTDKCFHTATTYTLGEKGQLPIGIYFGNVYDQGSLACAYNASQMQAVYGLPAVYKAGFKGEGQTIVIVDAFGSPTLMSDANEFNKLNNLPLFTSSTLKIVDSDGQPLAIPQSGNWVGETSIDVEWAHAIAPAAKIVVVTTPSEDDQDFQYAISYATMHQLGGVISNSYGTPETEHGSVTLEAYNQVIEQAAATGIAVNYASGDHSDLTLGTPVGATLVPSDAPYATAVGGTSIGIPGGTGHERDADRVRPGRHLRPAVQLWQRPWSRRWFEPVLPQAGMAEGPAGQISAGTGCIARGRSLHRRGAGLYRSDLRGDSRGDRGNESFDTDVLGFLGAGQSEGGTPSGTGCARHEPAAVRCRD
jgi:subtilase family serine protease